jgi:hypothetical protein
MKLDTHGRLNDFIDKTYSPSILDFCTTSLTDIMMLKVYTHSTKVNPKREVCTVLPPREFLSEVQQLIPGITQIFNMYVHFGIPGEEGHTSHESVVEEGEGRVVV